MCRLFRKKSLEKEFRMKTNLATILIGATLLAAATPALAQFQGPSSSRAPYVLPIAPGVTTTSILTTGDAVPLTGATGGGQYRMGGIPDGLGAYDNGDGTFTVLMNHEIFATGTGPLGITRAHGGKGSYVSEWIIKKKTLEVVSGSDLMRNVLQQAATGGWTAVPVAGTLGQTSSFARFCSADLAPRSAFWNAATRKGSKQRIFLNGEESAPTYQRGLAHVATGPDKGTTYVLPWAATANGAWENLLANPYSGERTVVIGNADGGTNGVYVYVGLKSATGNDVERAGLVGGSLYRVAVLGNAAETTAAAGAGLGLTLNSRGNYAGTFALVAGADTTNAASTKFLRPEDGAWDKKNHNRYFFVTTSQMDAAKDGLINPDDYASGVPLVGRTRLWALTFKDSSKPELGGTIEMLLDGTSAKGDYQMFDNIAVNDDGTITLLEDVGNNQHNGKVWEFNPRTGGLTKLAGFDVALFGDIGIPATVTKDEETSGVIDVSELLDRDDGVKYSLLVAQNHAATDAELVEGGQLLLLAQPAPNDDDGDGHDDGDAR
jgi:hypothetical protein